MINTIIMSMPWFIFVVLLFFCDVNICVGDYDLIINASSIGGNVPHFWDSTGFCPPAPRNKISNYLLSTDVKINLALISALPNRGIQQIRVHWLLDLITIKSFKNNHPVYNFTNLDLFLDWMYLNNLYPGFELMGNPSSYFNNFNDTKQQKEWSHLIQQIVQRTIHRYGFNYVSKWRFETWNEPDLHGYNIFNFTILDYRSYVSASSAGLRSADENSSRLKLGGPAGLFKSPDKHPLCWTLLNDCGNNNTTRSSNTSKSVKTLCPFDFISFHKKGDAEATNILNRTLDLIHYMRTKLPKLKHTPIANDESDLMTNWSKSKKWRGDVRYAAMIIQVIIEHYYKLMKEMQIDIEVLSNDNGFINYHPYYFTQRTLFARFQINNTNPPHIQFIKKPVYVAMAMLSYLGDKELNETCINVRNNFVHYFATASPRNNSHEYSILLTYVNDTYNNRNAQITFNVSVINLPNERNYKYVVYKIDNIVTNPYRMWKKYGKPVFPNKDVRNKMRQVEGPYRLVGPIDLSPTLDLLQLEFTMTLPQVVLLHICSDRDGSPGQVSKLQVYNVTYNEILLVWHAENIGTKCIRTFEIEFQADNHSNFKRVNNEDVIFHWYQYVVASGRQESTLGVYRIRAIDYWNRTGPYSIPVEYSNNI